jgi:hypothetical protein
MLPRLHQQLLDGSPTAPAAIAEALYGWLQRALRSAIPYASPDDVADVAADSVIAYVTDPRRFNPARGKGLASFLLMDARGDLLNLIDKKRRRPQLIELSDAVAERLVDRNVRLMTSERQRIQLPDHLEAAVATAIPSDADRAVLELMIERVRNTRSYAAVLGLERLAPSHQAREVKRVKDRIRARLKRAGFKP